LVIAAATLYRPDAHPELVGPTDVIYIAFSHTHCNLQQAMSKAISNL